MVGDDVRTSAFRASIAATVRPGDVVLDVGAGSGILSLFAAQAGAARVYGIERAPAAAALARRIVADNGLDDRVQIVDGDAESALLPEPVDVIVSEWCGVFGVDENMLAPVLAARDRWLKPGGRLIPGPVTAWIAPVFDPAGVEATAFHSRAYGLDLTALAPFGPDEAVWLPGRRRRGRAPGRAAAALGDGPGHHAGAPGQPAVRGAAVVQRARPRQRAGGVVLGRDAGSRAADERPGLPADPLGPVPVPGRERGRGAVRRSARCRLSLRAVPARRLAVPVVVADRRRSRSRFTTPAALVRPPTAPPWRIYAPARVSAGHGPRAGARRRGRGGRAARLRVAAAATIAQGGSLTVVGTGIRAIGQLTVEALAAMAEAEALLHVIGEPMQEEALQAINPAAETMTGYYVDGMERSSTYEAMVQRVLGEVTAGKRTVAAFYGHPGVFTYPSHESVRRARAAGFPARMLPAVSAEDCLFADLGIDPGDGCQSYEATDLLYRDRPFDPRAHLVLWQVGTLGNWTYESGGYDLQTFPMLVRKLLAVLSARASRDRLRGAVSSAWRPSRLAAADRPAARLADDARHDAAHPAGARGLVAGQSGGSAGLGTESWSCRRSSSVAVPARPNSSEGLRACRPKPPAYRPRHHERSIIARPAIRAACVWVGSASSAPAESRSSIAPDAPWHSDASGSLGAARWPRTSSTAALASARSSRSPWRREPRAGRARSRPLRDTSWRPAQPASSTQS